MTDLRVVPPPLTLPSDQDASGRTFGDEELALLTEVIHTGTLTSTKGPQVPALEARFAELLGARHAIACASGTAAVHLGVVAVDPEPGDEIITTPITDMGALSPILYQGAIPVFADVDVETCNVTADTIAARLSDRTRAIVVTHLFGNPCDMPAIEELARERGLPVIEDCAQAYLARSRGRLVGTIGAVGCFSLQQGKHITTGEGGIVVTNDDAHARRMRLYVNKAWPYGEADPDHEFLALNYRMTELQGAVARAQLEKLEAGVGQRVAMAERLTAQLADVDGITTPRALDGDAHTYWKYCLRVDERRVPGGPQALATELRVGGIASAPRYIQKPAFRCRVFVEQNTFGHSRFPFTLARPEALDYAEERFPGSFDALAGILVLPWNERYNEEHVDRLAEAIIESVARLQGGASS
ncbi:MAG TPA: DegT/DnrJ/EryC1/StrS family aminotransferase [Acidimicrobiia bacterium]